MKTLIDADSGSFANKSGSERVCREGEAVGTLGNPVDSSSRQQARLPSANHWLVSWMALKLVALNLLEVAISRGMIADSYVVRVMGSVGE